MVRSFFLGFFLASTIWLGAYIVWMEYQERMRPKIKPVPVMPFECPSNPMPPTPPMPT